MMLLTVAIVVAVQECDASKVSYMSHRQST
jgi:hypothetical protein